MAEFFPKLMKIQVYRFQLNESQINIKKIIQTHHDQIAHSDKVKRNFKAEVKSHIKYRDTKIRITVDFLSETKKTEDSGMLASKV